MYDNMAKMRKLADGAMIRLAARAAEAGDAARDGDRSDAENLAKQNGTSKKKAQDELDTSKRLADQPGLDDALRNGELSSEQANTISDAAEKDPSAEKKLLDTAKRSTLGDLKDEANKVKANAEDDAARRKRIHDGRSLRTYTDGDGFAHLHLKGPTEDIDFVAKRVAPYAHAAFTKARDEGRRERHDAYAYDGFLNLVRSIGTDSEAPKGASQHDTKTFVHVDYATLLRGTLEPGSICHIDGLGPVDLAWVRQNLGESFVALLLKGPGGTIRDLVHLGRDATTLQRSLKEAQGLHCEIPGCTCNKNLELHHLGGTRGHGYADTGTTTVDDLAWACPHHHDLITHRRYTLTGPPGAPTWAAPDGRIIAQDRPPPPSAEAHTTSGAEPAATRRF